MATESQFVGPLAGAVAETGLNFSEVARKLGLSKGRISQIRSSAPAPERALFGVGPLTLALPLRSGDRPEGSVSCHDALAADRMERLLVSLGFVVDRFHIPVGGSWDPPADTVAICGPKSSTVIASAIAHDPFIQFSFIQFSPDAAGKWELAAGGEVFRSPLDHGGGRADMAYVGRLPLGEQSVFVVAGVHALGSVGAVDYLIHNADVVYQSAGQSQFSMIVRSSFDDSGVPDATEAIWGPRIHQST